MTDRIETSEPSLDVLHGAVEAFLDGETVDPSTLRAALADQAARDHFVDLLIIRGTLNGMPSAAMSAARLPSGARWRTKWFAAAAAGVLISVTAGYLAGQRVIASTMAPSTVEAIVVVDSVPAAPQPTRSIALKPGINWTDTSGGR